MIEVCGLQKSYFLSSPLRQLIRPRSKGRISVLKGVDLSVSQGDFVALLGANGAGKTTILKILSTLALPDAGTATVLGMDVPKNGKQVREKVGYVMADERSFHWRLTATENLEFFARLEGIPADARRQRIRFLLSRLDLADANNRPFGQFSTGMKQRLAVARALLKRPQVLLMDEPTRSVDSSHAADVWQLVREEVDAASGCLLLVTHQVEEALTLCDRVAILSDGVVVLDTSSESFEQHTGELDGFTVSARGLNGTVLDQLRLLPGVRSVRVVFQQGSETTLEVGTRNGDVAIAPVLATLTGTGATIVSMQRAIPMLGVIDRILSESRSLSA